MRVAIVTPVFPPYAGGIGNVAYFNARELTKLGHQVEVFTPLYQPVANEIQDFKVSRVKPLLKYGNAAFVPALHFLLKGFDIIHLHYPFFGGAEVLWLYRRKLKKSGAQIVLHYHMDTVGQGKFKLIFGFSKTFILPRIIALADKVIVTSKDYAKNSDLARYLTRQPGKFSEVPNGVDSKKFIPTDKDQGLLEQHNIQPGAKVVLFVGSLDQAHYFKGVEGLIEAFDRLKQTDQQLKLMIVGQGDLAAQYKSLAVQLGMERDIIFTGYVPNENLPQYYNLADVVVLPSVDKSEAFGMVLVEAMACGKPVVATNLAGVRGVVEDGVNGYVAEVKNVETLAAKIKMILSDGELGRKFGQAGRKKVEDQYGWDKIGQQLEEVYKNL